MFKDTDQELARLEAELLKEEDEEELPPEEEEEESPDNDYEDTRPAEDVAVYQNYSNDYGRDLRNYASGYRAYNSDACDEDLDTFSDDVYDTPPESGNRGLLVTACVLSVILVGLVLFLLLRIRGIL